MSTPRLWRSAALFSVLVCALSACAAPEPMPGTGPGGRAIPPASETAVGVPPAGPRPLVYPITAKLNIPGSYLGARDPYSWLEKLDSPQVQQWVQAQNALSQPRLAALPARPWLKARLSELWHYERWDLPVKRGGRYFYLHNDGAQDESVLMVAEQLEAPARVLFDPNTARADATVAISAFSPDVRGDIVAYAVVEEGSDWQVWHFRRASDGWALPDTLRYTKLWGLSWARDDSGVYYSRYPSLANGRGDDSARPAVYFHKLGTPQEQDALVYQVSNHPTHVPSAQVSEDGRYLIVTLNEGSDRNGVELLDLQHPGEPARPLFAGWDALYNYIGVDGHELYFLSTHDAPLGHVIAIDPRAPQAARVVVHEGASALQDASLVGGRIIASYVENARAVIRVYAPDGRPVGEVPLPGMGSAEGFAGENAQSETFYSYTDYLTPRRIYRLEVSENRPSLWHAPHVEALSNFVTEQVYYHSKDGARVPMYITHRRDLAKDGNQVVLLQGYGGFDEELTPVYRPAVQAWLEMGGVYVEAKVRAAGEYGEARQSAVTLASKQHLFDDFIAAAEYLIDQHYTRSSRLGTYGRSNGGLLVGAVMTERPDLFGAVLPAVGVRDLRRDRTAGANARQRLLSGDPQRLQPLDAYSPAQNIKKATCYPPTLITSANHDDRLVPWHSYKFAAALQAQQVCANPILIRIETRAGHAGGEPSWMQIEDDADQWAFLAKWLQLAVPAP